MFRSLRISLESHTFYCGRIAAVKTETRSYVFQTASVEFRHQHCLVIVEGMDDVLRMECLQVAAIGLGSNKVTAEQLDKITRFARQLANNQVLLLPDCDEDGRLDSKICSGDSAKPNFRYDLRGRVRPHPNRQPESLTTGGWYEMSTG